MGAELVARSFRVKPAFDRAQMYRLIEDDDDAALNSGAPQDIDGVDGAPTKLSERLRKEILKVYGKYLSDDGKARQHDMYLC